MTLFGLFLLNLKMNSEIRQKRSLIFEWVKDGNYLDLREYFTNITPDILAIIFALRDSQDRTLLHWAAYLGQALLLEWWIQDYLDIIMIDLKDDQNYTPLDLGVIRGFNTEYDADL